MAWLLDIALKNAGAVFDDGPVGVGLARRRGPQPRHRAEPGIDRGDRGRGHQETARPGPPGRVRRGQPPSRQGGSGYDRHARADRAGLPGCLRPARRRRRYGRRPTRRWRSPFTRSAYRRPARARCARCWMTWCARSPTCWSASARLSPPGTWSPRWSRRRGPRRPATRAPSTPEKHLDIDQAWRFVVGDGVITAVTVYWCQAQLYRRLAVKRYDADRDRLRRGVTMTEATQAPAPPSRRPGS